MNTHDEENYDEYDQPFYGNNPDDGFISDLPDWFLPQPHPDPNYIPEYMRADAEADDILSDWQKPNWLKEGF